MRQTLAMLAFALGVAATLGWLQTRVLLARIRQERAELRWRNENLHWIQYGARHAADGSITVYRSPAANSNDPVFGRGGANTVARLMHGDTPVSEWRRVYPQDEKALRNQD